MTAPLTAMADTSTTSTSTAEGEERLVAEVHGHVQGVGFRYFVRGIARKLSLKGIVRNDPDGVVTIVAEGQREALGELLGALHEGPELAEVDEVDEVWEAPRGRFEGFVIEYY